MPRVLPALGALCRVRDARLETTEVGKRLGNALPVNVNSAGGMNCFWPMPFRKRARITLTNDAAEDLGALYYTVNYTLEEAPEGALAFHASWRGGRTRSSAGRT